MSTLKKLVPYLKPEACVSPTMFLWISSVMNGSANLLPVRKLIDVSLQSAAEATAADVSMAQATSDLEKREANFISVPLLLAMPPAAMALSTSKQKPAHPRTPVAERCDA